MTPRIIPKRAQLKPSMDPVLAEPLISPEGFVPGVEGPVPEGEEGVPGVVPEGEEGVPGVVPEGEEGVPGVVPEGEEGVAGAGPAGGTPGVSGGINPEGVVPGSPVEGIPVCPSPFAPK